MELKVGTCFTGGSFATDKLREANVVRKIETNILIIPKKANGNDKKLPALLMKLLGF